MKTCSAAPGPCVRTAPGILAAVAAACIAAGGAASAGETAIVGARIHPAPDAPVIERGTVLVRDGRIAAVGPRDEVAVPPGARVVDARGKVLMAGFWNSHVHLLGPEFAPDPARPAAEVEAALEAMFTRWGFTTVFDIASFGGAGPALRARIEAGDVQGPRILTVDAPFFPEGGTPVYIRDLLSRMEVPGAEVASADEAAARASRQLAAGADGVKLFAGAIVGGEAGVLPMDAGIARAVAGAAHRAGKPAFSHPSNAEGLEVSLASGVDVLAHTTPFTGPWDEALVARLRAADVALTPTLTLFEVELRREQVPEHVLEAMLADAIGQVRAFAGAGGTVLFGTDVGYIDHVDTRREFELMARAGMDWRGILASLTSAPAERFGQGGERGRVAAGLQADLVLLARDPADDVTAFADVALVMRGGDVAYVAPAAGPADAARGLEPLAWLAGCWSNPRGEAGSGEYWQPPAGGTMLGVGRLVRDGSTVGYEFLRLHVDAQGRIVYTATPSGQAEASFVASAIADGAATFENPAHDFPQRIAYARDGPAGMSVRISGPRQGVERAVDFRFERVDCGD